MTKLQKKLDMKGFSMIRKTMIVSLVFAVVAWAAQDSVHMQDTTKEKHGIRPIDASELNKLEMAVSKAVSKAGISLGGEFNSQFLLSTVEGRAVAKSFRKEEGVEFTGCDLDIDARPASELTAKLMFRFYEDWRNMWNSFKDPVNVRWISVDGTVKNVFSYSVGDFRQKYSPLTLYSPDIDIAYEPELFSQQRSAITREMFLGDNERILQGINFNFDAEVSPLVKELHWNVMGARLRNVDFTLNTLQSVSHYDTSVMDKYAYGTNLNVSVLNGLGIGGTFLNILDATQSFSGPISVAEDMAQNTRIIAGRINVGSQMIVPNKPFDIGLFGEVAASMDDSVAYDTISKILPVQTARSIQTVQGMALSVNLKGYVQLGASNMFHYDAGFVSNNSNYRNDLAQSPSFLKTRIMNSENDLNSAALYSTFDGLYRQVFKFSPSQTAQNFGASSGWMMGPVQKIAYTNGILTQKEIRNVARDNSLCLAMPLGAATPNRQGGTANLSADFLDKAIIASVCAKYFNELDGQTAMVDTLTKQIGLFPQTTFSEFGGGASVDIAAFGKWWPFPFVLSGGYTVSQAANNGIANFANSPWTTTINFANAGLSWTFIKKMALLAGYQYLATTGDGLYNNINTTVKQLHYAAGLEYKVSDGAYVTGSYGVIEVHNENDADTDLSNKDFRQYQTELYLTVNF